MNQAAQTSATSPFNGTSGTGHGTLARRPTTCTTGVGYLATDQGNWNVSGNSFGQGEMFVCTATNVWSDYYLPYTYPHPITGGSGSPNVLTTTASSITGSAASAGGNVTSDGGGTVSARGTCYATSSAPTTPCTSDGSGVGAFTSSISGLSAATTYHYRSFTTNGSGTSYGAEFTFQTSGASAAGSSIGSKVFMGGPVVIR